MPRHRRFPRVASGAAGRREGAPKRGPEVSDLGGLLLLLSLLKAADEQGLVDPALEDRYSELHALADDFTPVHARFPSEFRGRQVDRHIPAPLLMRSRIVSCTATSGHREV